MKKTLTIIIISILVIAWTLIFFLLPEKVYITVTDVNNVVGLNDTFKIPNYKACIGHKYFKDLFECKDVTSDVIVTNNVDTTSIGDYIFNISVEGETKKYVVSVEDKNAPTISLQGSNPSYVCPNTEYAEEGYSAFDDVDGDLTSNVQVTKDYGSNTYSVMDGSSNKAVEYRYIIYQDKDLPVITLIGNKTVNMYVNEKFVEKGYTAVDNCDGNITSNVVITGEVNTNKVGKYVLTYSVTDSSSNTASEVRTVNVLTKTIQIVDTKSDDSSSIAAAVVSSGTKTIYLTFDDGPGAATEKLLDVLKKYNVKATFFVTNQFPKYAYLIKREYDEGHSVGLHTYTHVWKKVYGNDEMYFSDLAKISDLVKEQTGGYESKMIRFPGGTSNTVAGSLSKGIMSRLSVEVVNRGYAYFDWNVDSQDASGKKISTNTVAQNIIKGISGKKDAYIVLQHDYKLFSVNAVEQVIKYGLSKGYTFAGLTTSSPAIRFQAKK